MLNLWCGLLCAQGFRSRVKDEGIAYSRKFEAGANLRLVGYDHLFLKCSLLRITRHKPHEKLLNQETAVGTGPSWYRHLDTLSRGETRSRYWHSTLLLRSDDFATDITEAVQIMSQRFSP